jgi:Glucuronate isomerase
MTYDLQLTTFIHDNFLLETEAAQTLYHCYAKDLPIIDYHCHLNPKEIADDKRFANMTDIWLRGDHYKWRAMRANGIDEKYITGGDSDYEKFEKWAETMPYCLRNPLYHWAHLELNRPFGIKKLLSPTTAKEIYDDASAKLQTAEFSVRNIMREWKVEVVCTTDDPIDSLEYHRKIKEDGFEVKVLPTWRPDKAMAVENPDAWNDYLAKLEVASGVRINVFSHLIEALKIRQQHFIEHGCKLSDHGIERFYAERYMEEDINHIFNKVRAGELLTEVEVNQFKSAMMVELGVMNYDAGWVQQFHYGPLRNTNTKMFNKLGADAGYDSMGDLNVARDLATYLNRLESIGCLTKTIIYNINPKDNDMVATMIGNFQDGSTPGKIQFGAGWWFLDQKNGMEAQMNTLSNHGLLSRFVGMLTDSRSFLSYSRHEYFRRILCNMLGNDIEKGLIPNDMDLVGTMVQNICYYNAKQYFQF